jgi:hypothetical protein
LVGLRNGFGKKERTIAELLHAFADSEIKESD